MFISRSLCTRCILSWVLLLALTSFGTPLLAQSDTAWTGTWQLSFQGGAATLKTTQSGNRVSGSYDWYGGKIEGTVKGNVMTGTWTNTSGSGPFDWKMAPDGRSFQGFYSWQGANYAWGGTRIQAPPPPSQDIGLNGCWNQCSIHIYQNRDGALYFSSAWKNPPDCKDCDIRGWKLNRGKGQITGQDVHLYEIVTPTQLKDIYGHYKTDQPSPSEYFLKLSADGNVLEGYWGLKGQPSGYVTWRRDK